MVFGLNNKLRAVTDARGRPLRFFMTAGQVRLARVEQGAQFGFLIFSSRYPTV